MNYLLFDYLLLHAVLNYSMLQKGNNYPNNHKNNSNILILVVAVSMIVFTMIIFMTIIVALALAIYNNKNKFSSVNNVTIHLL